MTTARRGNLFVISAPSGSGKTTLVRRLLDTLDDVRFSVSFTTRTVRGSERDGIDYHFVPSDLFRAKIEDGEFLEWAEVHGNYYGTSKIEVAPETRNLFGDIGSLDETGDFHRDGRRLES